MKKKLTLLLLAFLMCLSAVLCGCSLVETNMSAYYNKPVVTLTYPDKTVETINMKEYMIALNNYGSSLMSKNNYTADQAIEATVNALINRRVLLVEAKKQVTLVDTDKNDLWNDVFEALNANLEDYKDEIRIEWEITLPAEETEEESDAVLYTPYERVAYVTTEDNKYVIKVVNEGHDEETAPAKNIDDMQALIFTQNKTNGSRLQKEALKRYIKQLKLNEDGQRLSTDDAEVFAREVSRIYKNLEENLYITKLQNVYQYGNPNGANGDYTSSITVDDVLAKYRSMMLVSQTLYTANSTTYNSNMLESMDSVNYAIDDNYFFVSHVLMKFTTEQENELKNINNLYETGEITAPVYKQKLDNLYDNVKAIIRDENGEIIEDSTLTCNQLLNMINTELSAIEQTYTTRINALDLNTLGQAGYNAQREMLETEMYEKKVEAFKNYIYKHNEDPGIMNADYMYVIGENDSKMVENFTNTSRDLNDAGKLGAVSGLVRSDYGLHIIFYAGKVQNAFTIPTDVDFTLQDSDIMTLVNTKLNAFNNKTLFDKVYNLLVKDNYTSFETAQIRVLKQDISIVKHVSNYKN